MAPPRVLGMVFVKAGPVLLTLPISASAWAQPCDPFRWNLSSAGCGARMGGHSPRVRQSETRDTALNGSSSLHNLANLSI